MIDVRSQGDAQDRATVLAPSSKYLETVNPGLDEDQLPPYPGGHFLHMLATGPKNVEDVASHLRVGRAAAREMLEAHVTHRLVVEEAGLYSLSIPGVLNALTSAWPKQRWQEELLVSGREWDCAAACILPGDR